MNVIHKYNLLILQGLSIDGFSPFPSKRLLLLLNGCGSLRPGPDGDKSSGRDWDDEEGSCCCCCCCCCCSSWCCSCCCRLSSSLVVATGSQLSKSDEKAVAPSSIGTSMAIYRVPIARKKLYPHFHQPKSSNERKTSPIGNILWKNYRFGLLHKQNLSLMLPSNDQTENYHLVVSPRQSRSRAAVFKLWDDASLVGTRAALSWERGTCPTDETHRKNIQRDSWGCGRVDTKWKVWKLMF